MEVNRSTVTRWAQQGRLVLAPNGKVMVQESIAKINATEGHRIDLKDRHAAKRNTVASAATNHVYDAYSESDDESLTEHNGETTTQYQAIRYQAENDLNALQRDLETGQRFKKDEFTKEMAAIARHIKQGMERMTDNLSPQLRLNANDRFELIEKSVQELKGSIQ